MGPFHELVQNLYWFGSPLYVQSLSKWKSLLHLGLKYIIELNIFTSIISTMDLDLNEFTWTLGFAPWILYFHYALLREISLIKLMTSCPCYASIHDLWYLPGCLMFLFPLTMIFSLFRISIVVGLCCTLWKYLNGFSLSLIGSGFNLLLKPLFVILPLILWH